MKRRIPALLLVLALVACAAIGLAACNEGGKDGGEAGDNIFTEDASYDDIYNALANAKSYQVTSADGEMVYVETFTSVFYHFNADLMAYDSYLFIDGEYLYSVATDDSVESVGMAVEKQLAKYEGYEFPLMSAAEYLEDLGLVIEKDGKLVFDEEGAMAEMEDYVVGSGYIRYEGDALYLGYTYNRDEDGEMKTEYCIRGVNAQYSLPDEIRALQAKAEWAEYVYYNGVEYAKAEDELGEFYEILYTFEGGIPEETINTLPVRV